jgi:Fe-S-cluster containining protein
MARRKRDLRSIAVRNHEIETDLAEIEALASDREDENFRFRTFLKGKDSEKTDRIVHRLHKEYSEKIDCTLCGNCCRTLKTGLSVDDIETLAQLENITPEDYKSKYCEQDVLQSLPCRYLAENKCSIYENRPEECRSFPHTHKENFTSRSLSMLSFYEVCPIVFNLMEQLKNEPTNNEH